MLEQPSPEPKIQVFLPSYLPLKVETCVKCNQVIANDKEIIRITKEVNASRVCL
jgi:hypothetical protein